MTMMNEPGIHELPWNEVEALRRERMIKYCTQSCAYLAQCSRLPNEYSNKVDHCTKDDVQYILFDSNNLVYQVHKPSYRLCYIDCYYGSIFRSLFRQINYNRRPHVGPAWAHT